MKLNIQLFASGTINGSSTATSADCQIVWESTSNGSSANSSNLTVKIQIKRSGSSSTTGTFSGTLKINGTSYSVSKKFSPYNWGSWATVATKTLTIAHNSDGTKTVAISGSLTQTGTSMAGTYTASGNATLDTIPRGSAFDTSSWNRDTQRDLNTTLSFPAYQYITPAYHKLEARFLKSDGTEQTITSRTGISISNNAISFAFTSSELSIIYNLMSSETTHFIRMYLMTYSDSDYTSQIGDTSVLWWTGKVPETIVPTVSIGEPTEAGSVPTSWGVFVKSKSKIVYVLTGTGSYGSTIKSYSSTANGYTYTTASVTTGELTQKGTNTISATVVDSRGRSGKASRTFNVEDYTVPTINTSLVQRCDETGKIDEQGEYLYFNFEGSVSSCLNHNKGTFVISYKLKDETDYTDITITSNVEEYIGAGLLTNSGTKVYFDPVNSYDIKFTITDYFGTSSSNSSELLTGFDLINFAPSGNSMAFGKVSEREDGESFFDVAFETVFDKTVHADIDGNSATSTTAETANKTTGTITIQKNGTNVGTFNGSSNQTINIDNVQDTLSNSTGSISLTKSSGNSTMTGSYIRYGNVIELIFAISTTGSIDSGSNIWVGTMSGITLPQGATLIGFIGTRAIVVNINSDLSITVRNAGTSTISSGSNLTCRGTAICS